MPLQDANADRGRGREIDGQKQEEIPNRHGHQSDPRQEKLVEFKQGRATNHRWLVIHG